MSNSNQQAAQRISAGVLSAEEFLDDFIATAGTLTASCVAARRESGAHVGVGQLALQQIAVALQQAIEARRAIARAHQSLAGVADEFGIDTSAYGDISECPPIKPNSARLNRQESVSEQIG